MNKASNEPENGNPAAAERERLAAEEKLRQAKEALRDAEREYADARVKAGDDCCDMGPLGDVCDNVMTMVKNHPGLGVAAAACVGFVLGRLIPRW